MSQFNKSCITGVRRHGKTESPEMTLPVKNAEYPKINFFISKIREFAPPPTKWRQILGNGILQNNMDYIIIHVKDELIVVASSRTF